MLITSAPRRFPASSKLVRVRVEFLEEQVDQGPAAEQVALGFSGAVEENVAFGQVEQVLDVGRVEAFD